VVGDLSNRVKIFFRKKGGFPQNNSREQCIPFNRTRLYELRPIVLRDDYQGSGLAEALIAKVEVALKEKHEEKYFLRVYKDNFRAINFYQKTGFIEVCSEGSNTLIMEKALI